MSEVKSYTIKLVTRQEIKAFIEKWHYSKSINGVKSTYCFGLYRNEELIGAALFGEPATKGVSEAYAKREEIIELRRLCLIDNTPRNAESFFIGKMLRYLKQNTNLKYILSYADAAYGHEGIIYKATNFKLVGQTVPVNKLLWNGKLYHDRSLRVKYKGKLKPFSARLKAAVSAGEAVWVPGKAKNIYLYTLWNPPLHGSGN